MKRLIAGLMGIALVLGIGIIFVKFVYFTPQGSSGIKTNQPASQDQREPLEVKKDQLTLQRNLKQQDYLALLKDAPCGAKTQEMMILHNEISSIDQRIIEIEGKLKKLGNE
jgi:hypothetical protein